MKFINHFTTALCMIGAFPEYSAGIALPSRRQLDPVPASPSPVGSLTDSSKSLHCKPVYGCQILSENATPRYCSEDPGFFATTDENKHESLAGQVYLDFTKTINKPSPEWSNRISEPNFFAQQVLGWPDFDCGRSFGGCKNMPSCDDILTRIGDKEKARQIYFTMREMDHMVFASGVVADQAIPAQVNMLAMSDSMAHTFVWKHDDSIDPFVVLGAVAGPEAIGAAAATEGALAGAAAGAAAEAGSVLATTAVRSSPWTYVATLVNGVASYYKSSGAGQIELAVKFASNFPTNVGGDAITQGICKNFANAPKELEQEWKLALDEMIRTNFVHYRRLVDESIGNITYGVAIGDPLPGGTTVLANVLQDGEWLEFTNEQHRRFVTEPSLIEQDLTTQFKNAAISVVLKKNMCYIQCSARRSKQSDLSSFTPLGELGRFCEAKCWQNWKGEKSLKLFGLDELVKEGNEWDIALKDYLVASYDHFKSVGLRSDRLIPSVEELFQGTVSSTSGSFLPVCNSYMPPKADSFSGIPCMCGDQYGSETLAFWKEANFASWIQSKDTGSQMTTRQAPYLCKNDMAIYRVAPVSYYLNLCNMGWHWPSQTENSSYLMRGADAACEPFKAAVDEWQERRKSDSPFPVGQGADVDCDMCYQNDVGKLVRHSQAALIDNLFFNSYNDAEFQNYNFRRACELYREIAPKGSGCELGIIIDGLPAKVIPSSMGSNPTVSNSTVLKSSTG